MKPAKPYTLASASAKAREIHPSAFAKVAVDSPRRERCQVLVEDAGPLAVHAPLAQPRPVTTYLVASGPDWVTTLQRFYEWMEETNGAKEG